MPPDPMWQTAYSEGSTVEYIIIVYTVQTLSYSRLQYNEVETVQYSKVQHIAVQYYAAQYGKVQYSREGAQTAMASSEKSDILYSRIQLSANSAIHYSIVHSSIARNDQSYYQ